MDHGLEGKLQLEHQTFRLLRVLWVTRQGKVELPIDPDDPNPEDTCRVVFGYFDFIEHGRARRRYSFLPVPGEPLPLWWDDKIHGEAVRRVRDRMFRNERIQDTIRESKASQIYQIGTAAVPPKLR